MVPAYATVEEEKTSESGRKFGKKKKPSLLAPPTVTECPAGLPSLPLSLPL